MTLSVSPPRRRAAALAGTLAALLAVAPPPAHAESPSPGPTPVSSPASTPAPGTPAPASPDPSSSASATAAPTAAPTSESPGRSSAAAADEVGLTLRVAASGSPVKDRFFQDLGRFGFSGTATGLAEGTAVEVYRRTAGATTWSRVAGTTVSQGAWSASLPVTAIGVVTFVATTGGAPGSGDELTSPQVQVSVADARLTLDKPAATVDSLKKPALTGAVTPARSGVTVHVDVLRGSSFRFTAKGTTDAAGRFRITFGHGQGSLARYTVRAAYHAANRDRWERTGTRTVKRVAVLNPTVTATTAAEVEKTYRKGCPVGRSKLSTITMNYYGRDKLMHRGVLIIRTDLVPEIKRSFQKGLDARFPIAKMDNPNVYGGNDPKQMEANNTSGFNCRKVVGNPYAQSPHSYGTAIDVTPVQNPYRDSRGKWWPENGKSYIDRTPLRFGMLSAGSSLTKQLRSDGFFWGGLWNPGRDYQHFEYRR